MTALRLTGPRLALRPLASADVPAFAVYRRDPAIARWQSWDTDYSETSGHALVARQQGWTTPPPGEWLQLASHSLDDGRLLGDVAVHAVDGQPDSFEIGFTLAVAEHGKGYATEAAALLVDYLFTTLGAHRVSAECDARNRASARVLERIGMRQESHRVLADWFKDEWTTVDGYAMLRGDLRELPG